MLGTMPSQRRDAEQCGNPHHMRSNRTLRLLAACALALAGGCASVATPDATPAPTDFFKHTGARQCETPSFSAARLQAEVVALRQAGIGVSKAQCGTDGNAYPAVCGGSTGDVWVLTVAPKSAPGMLSRGYRALNPALPIAIQACR